MATVLIQNGTLRIGDPFVVGVHYGRVRAMLDDRGKRLKEVGPATPVEVLGLTGVPTAGDSFLVVEGEREARLILNLARSNSKKRNSRKHPKSRSKNYIIILKTEKPRNFELSSRPMSMALSKPYRMR